MGWAGLGWAGLDWTSLSVPKQAYEDSYCQLLPLFLLVALSAPWLFDSFGLRAVPEIILGGALFFFQTPPPPGHVSALINPPHYGSNMP